MLKIICIVFLCSSCVTSSLKYCEVSYNGTILDAIKEPYIKQNQLIVDTVTGKLILNLKKNDSVKTKCD